MNPLQLSDVVAAAIGHNSPNIVSLDDDDASDVTASAIIIGSERVIVVGALSEVAGPSGTSYLMQYLLTAIYLLSASFLIGFVYCSFSATAASAAADPGGVE